MLYLTCMMLSSVDLAYFGVSRGKDWVSVDCGTIIPYYIPHTPAGSCFIAFYMSSPV